MYLIEIFKILSLFLLIFIGIVNVGYISNRLFFKQKNFIEINIIFGILSLSILIGVILSLKIFDIKILFGILSISYLLLFLYKKTAPKNLISSKNIIIYIILLFIICASLKNNFYTLDDLNGYFYLINNFIHKTNLYNADLQHRLYFSYPLFSTLNSLFISVSDLYSSWFFDLFFGTTIILFTLKRNLKENNFFFYSISIVTVFLATTTTQETNTPKLIVIGFLLFTLFEIEKFYKNNDNLLLVFALSSLLIILKFTNIASFTNCLILILLINKFIKKKILLKEIIKPLLISFLIFLPWFIYSYQTFGTPISSFLSSPYHYLKNYYFLNLNLNFTYKFNLLEYIYSRQLLLCVLLTVAYFLISKSNKFFKLSLIISFLMCLLFYIKISYSDKSNFFRYMQPFFSVYAAFIFIKIFNQLTAVKKNFKSIVLLFLLILITIRANHNITYFFHNSLNNISYLIDRNYFKFYKSANKYFKTEELYPKDYKKKINEVASITNFEKTLLLVSRPYLFDFKKYNNIDYIEWRYGYAITKQTFPLLQSDEKKIQFFKKKKIKYFLIEKRYLKHVDGLIKRHLNNNKKNIVNIAGRQINSHFDTLLYDDLMGFILNYKKKIIIKENSLFNLYKVWY